MANKLENLVQHAIRTFKSSSRRFPEVFQSDINELRRLTDEITIKDVSAARMYLQKIEVNELLGKVLRSKMTPMDYLPVHEDDEVTVGVFILEQGAKLPIHDHPSMHGILKVLKGVIKITSYSLIDLDTSLSIQGGNYYSNPLKVVKHPISSLTDKDCSCLLTPTERNIHEVECTNGPAAFLDILSPPYGDDNSRTCHYFKEIEGTGKDECIRLKEINNPRYWTDSYESM